MLKYEHTLTKDRLEFQGKVDDLVAEVTFLIRRVYQSIRKKDAAAADVFRDLVIRIVAGEDSPVWEDAPSLKERLAHKLGELLSKEQKRAAPR